MILYSYRVEILSDMLCAISLLCTAGFAPGAPTVEPLVPNMDSHGNDNYAWPAELCFEHSGVPQSAPRLKYIIDVTHMVLKYVSYLK